jgi:mannose-6-phosphate isomerase-like protein (cupin superfamily)
MKDLVETVTSGVWSGAQFNVLVSSEATGGALSMVDTVNPPFWGPPRDIHHAEDEVLFVLSGDVEVMLAGTRSLVGPGQAVFVPRGVEHSFRVVGLVPARIVVNLTPSGFEGFFADMIRGQFRIPEDMPAIIESATKHRMTFTGPPLGDAA